MSAVRDRTAKDGLVQQARWFSLAAVMVAFAASAAAAGLPAGIIIAVSGDTEPSLSPMTEIPADQPLTLGAGAKLTFLHYALCRLITVTGGTVTLQRNQFHTDGRIEGDEAGPCPRVYVPEEAAPAGRTTGGLLLRGGEAPPRWPVDPEFLFTGPRGRLVMAAEIDAEDPPDAPVLRLAVRAQRATLPVDALPLLPGRRYVLKLSLRDQPKPIEVTFIGTPPGETGSLIVLRLD